MTFTPDEASKIKSDVESLKHSTTSVLLAIGESVTAQKENTKMITDLLVEMRERDVRDEYRGKEIKALEEHVDRIDSKVDENRKEFVPSIQRLIKTQGRVDDFWRAFNSSWGKMTFVIVAVGIAYAIGLDFKSLYPK